MNELETIRRKIVLKRQAIPLIRREIVEHEDSFVLLRMRERLEKQIKDDFDPVLSTKLSCLIYLLEN